MSAESSKFLTVEEAAELTGLPSRKMKQCLQDRLEYDLSHDDWMSLHKARFSCEWFARLRDYGVTVDQVVNLMTRLTRRGSNLDDIDGRIEGYCWAIVEGGFTPQMAHEYATRSSSEGADWVQFKSSPLGLNSPAHVVSLPYYEDDEDSLPSLSARRKA